MRDKTVEKTATWGHMYQCQTGSVALFQYFDANVMSDVAAAAPFFARSYIDHKISVVPSATLFDQHMHIAGNHA